jgi:glycosyltransferase involved in cell wall biosynthesis
MRFSVDAHAIGRHLTGNEVYIRNLLSGFASLDKSSEFIAYLSESGANAEVPANIEVRRVAQNPFLRLGLDLSRQLRIDRPDLLHVQYTAPLGCPVPVVVSVHDVSFLEHPEFFSWSRQLQLRCTVERTVRKAARVLTPSEFSREAVIRRYRLHPDRVVAIPYAVSPVFRPIARETARESVRGRFGIPEPFVLMVSDVQIRKNQVGLVRAFAAMLRAHPDFPHHLVLVGQPTAYAAKVRAAAESEGIGPRVHFTGFVSDDELLQLYGACDLFAFPSFYEGFGIPILEAMACGRAVACSKTSAMLEVADGAALVFDPASTEAVARAMSDLLLDAGLRTRMERLGLQRATQFSWEQSARKTLDVYYEVAGSSSLASRSARPITASRS